MDLLVKTVCQNSFAKLVINAIKVAHFHWFWFSVQNCTENWLYMFLTLRMMFFVINNQLFSFSSDKDRRTDSRIRRKKHSAAPPGIEPRILRILGSIPGGAALCFFRLIRLSVLLSLSELKEKS